MQFPQMIKIKQAYDCSHIVNIEQAVRNEILDKMPKLKPHSRIAVATGSRGIAKIDRIIKATVDTLAELGYVPFIIPAMGSHGGATADGQKAVLESYGISEESMGVPICSSMEVVEIARGDCPVPVYMDRYAYEADATVIVNRIKVHTDFHAIHESGLIKMCVIGLGKHKQAIAIHHYGVDGLVNFILPAARQILLNGNILLGLAIVENAYDQPTIIQAVPPDKFEIEDSSLLQISRELMPKLPTKAIDILIVDELGKNISGTGLDTNIIGRTRIQGFSDPESPRIKAIIIADLTKESHGNALGIGLADFITRELADKIDFASTYENALTSGFNLRAHIPIVAPTLEEACEWAMRICGPVERDTVKIVRIRNTLQIAECYISESILGEVLQLPGISMISEPMPLFNELGELHLF